MKKCLVCGKQLEKGQEKYCSHKCRLIGLHQKNQKKYTAGRKTKLNEELIKKICNFIRAGNYIETACQAVGIDPSTFYRWRKKGSLEQDSEQDSLILQFCNAVKEAEAESEVALVLEIRKKATEDWRAADNILKKRFRERWGDNLGLTHGGKVEVEVEGLDKFTEEVLKNEEMQEKLLNIFEKVKNEQSGN